MIGKFAVLKTGKHKGAVVEVIHITEPHPLSSEVRYGVYVLSNGVYHTRRKIVNESSLEAINE